MEESVAAIEERIGYRFKDPSLLELAMTHSSCANEMDKPLECNERLEFLGDAVLELCVSEELYVRYPEAQEGQMTKMRARLVGRQALAALARELGLAEHLRLGKGEEGQGGRQRASLLSDAFEALLGAVFLDGGYQNVRALAHRVYANHWPEEAEESHTKDCKSRLQELTQQLHKDRPIYMLDGSSGPEHAKVFEVLLTLPDGTEIRSQGHSLKKAEQRAACQALELLRERNNEDLEDADGPESESCDAADNDDES